MTRLRLRMPFPRALAVTLVAAAAAPAAAAAQPNLTGSGLSSAQQIGSDRHAPAITLPPVTASAASAAARSDARWFITAPGAPASALRALAREFGGTANTRLGVLSVPTSAARAASRRLGGSVIAAGPDITAKRASTFDRPDGSVSSWSRSVANPPSLTPAPGTLAPVGVVDDAVNTTVGELATAVIVNGVVPKDTHGTMVASTMAAPYNGSGVVGVAPGAQVYSWGVTSLSCTDVSTGISTLVDRGAKVINVSLGFDQLCSALERSVEYAYAHGVTVVSSAGNEGDQNNPLDYPSSYEHVISVAAMKPSFSIASFSNYDDYIDIAAPGTDVPVDIPIKDDTEDSAQDGVTTVDGTSFSSPFVVGSLSWVLGARPNLDPSQVAGVLRASSRDIEQPGWDPYSGYGLVQIDTALAAEAPAPDTLEPNDQPQFARAASKGLFGKPYIWDGGPKATIEASGDSADDDLDGYRVRVPAHTDVKVQLRPITGRVDLYGFRSSATNFYRSKPIAASRRGGSRIDTVWIRNSSSHTRAGFVVVNTQGADSSRLLSRYTLSVRAG